MNFQNSTYVKILHKQTQVPAPQCRIMCSTWNPPCLAWDSDISVVLFLFLQFFLQPTFIDDCTLYTFTGTEETDDSLNDHLMTANMWLAGTFNCKLGKCVAYEMRNTTFENDFFVFAKMEIFDTFFRTPS